MHVCWGEGVGVECEVRGVVKHRMQGREMLPMLAVGWRASAVRGEEGGRFRKVVGVSIFHFNSRMSLLQDKFQDTQLHCQCFHILLLCSPSSVFLPDEGEYSEQ